MPYIRFDWALKKILRNKVNFDILEGFLSELLKTDIKIQEILESESNKEHKESKLNRVDLLAKDGDGRLMLIEVQNNSEVDYFQRIAFGAARLVSDYLDEGKSYGAIKKVITVNIVYFALGQGKDYVYHGVTEFRGIHHHKDILKPSAKQKAMFRIDKVQDVFPEHYIIKVRQFDDKTQDRLDEWIYFLKNNRIESGFSARGLDKAKEKLDQIHLSMTDRDAYRVYVKDLRDEASYVFNKEIEIKDREDRAIRRGLKAGLKQGLEKGIEQGLEKGIEQGLEKGIEQGLEKGLEQGLEKGKLEVARALKASGIPLDIIAQSTGLSLEKIQSL